MIKLHGVYAVATISRLITITLAVISGLWTGTYDSSASIQLSSVSNVGRSILSVFLRWDALYFLHIADKGYIYEQEHAFLPGMPLVARLLANTVFRPLHVYLGRQYTLLLSGIVTANVSFILAAGALYSLTRSVFPNNVKLSGLAAVAFCVSPPSLFMSSFYTESLFAYLSFSGMNFMSRGHPLLASIVWSFASATRSNGIIYAGFFIYHLIIQPCLSRPFSFKVIILGVLRTVIYTALTWSGFLAFQYYGYLQHCTHEPLRPWCSSTFPLLYSFVQKEYWNNGFLAYYELKQLPNFLLAAPIIGLSIYGLWTYAQYDWTRFLTLGAVSRRPLGTSEDNTFTSFRAASYIYLWGVLLLYVTTTMHVQVILRFFTSLPPLYWFMAHLWTQGYDESNPKPSSSVHKLTANILLSYLVLYGMVGIVLFAGFLPPA
ncbi:dolichol-p-mannose mannosyltransferase [Radiomyces spectabilis]|uniref:dolichol-p-mannose mannosyltransferase n=1 Tax=Radiomyces spectabilis TaxID=64574 RepID=UPI00222089BD|nr:dolichol-p-mannose mannosyltransferase [Radiomyces spectabilis]KAI8394062.1 dolichol-p-mannose mannosyltransferase [Radiomyces spectabilis]